MKKIQLLLIAGAILAASCEKDKKKDIVDANTQEPKAFSTKDPVQQKADIQTSAIKLVNEMETLTTTKGAETAVYFAELMEDTEMLELKATPANVLIQTSALVQKETDLPKFLRTFSDFEEDSVNNINDAYDQVKGTYTYNKATGEFDEADGDKLVIKFPASETSTTNNAVFEVTEFKTGKYTSELLEEIENILPTAVKAQLTVDGEKVMEYIFAATYNADGTPTKIETSYTVSGFTFFAKMNNSDSKKLSTELGLKNAAKNIIVFKSGVNGFFTEKNYEDNTKYYVEDCVYSELGGKECDTTEVTKDDDWDWQEVAIEEILHSSYAFIEIFDIRIGGEIDVKNMAPVMNKIDDDYDVAYDAYWDNWKYGDGNFNDKEFEERYAAAYNEYMHCFAAYIADNKKIAELEFYVVEDKDDEGTYYNIDGRMIFGDKSKISAEAYFEEGFSDFFDEVNDMIADLNKDYDLDLHPVEYE
jgi:hypothetical protein